MCGIIGYIGKEKCFPVLLRGLHKMEYRGYDSAGISYYNNQKKLKVIKDKGKVNNLEKLVKTENLINSNVGIAHTRWATHGKVIKENAHPLLDKDSHIAIVHNGIVENFVDLKSKLIKEGFTFKSETDSEVIIHLISLYYDGSLEKAVIKALKSIQGTYGIVVLSAFEPDKIIAARSGSPLIIGKGENEHIVASDVLAMINRTQNVFYLEDGEMAIIKENNFIATSLKDYQTINRAFTKINKDTDNVDKKGYKYYMLKEIHEQAQSTRNAIRGRLSQEDSKPILSSLEHIHSFLVNVNRIIILGMGSSFYAGMFGKYFIENIASIPVDVENAAQFRYRKTILNKENTLVIVISQSGETADTLGALKEAKLRGIKTISLCNVVGSSIARESDGGCYLYAGPEIGVASTKVFTSELVVLVLIGFYLARMKSMTSEKGLSIIKEINNIPKLVDQTINICYKQIQQISKNFDDINHAFYLGRGYHFPIALEGALKLKEVAYIHAEGYHASELKHGPIALLNNNMIIVAIALDDNLYHKIISNIEEVKVRNDNVIIIANKGNKNINKFSDNIIYIPNAPDYLSPILSVIPLQLLAYFVAVNKNLNVDQPRNLAKSVTVE